MTKALIMMIGVPGSGKSTLAKTLYNPELDIIISRDEIRFNMLGQSDKYFAKEKAVFNKFITDINDAAAATKRYVFIDATHITPISRKKVIDKIKDKTIPIFACVVNTDLQTCLNRNDLREGLAKVPKSVIYNMYSQFSVPNDKEGFKLVSCWRTDENNDWAEERRYIYED